MKSLFLCLLLSAAVLAGDINSRLGYQPTYEKALEAAKSADAPLMIMVVSNDCRWCLKMEELTLSDKEVRDYMHGRLFAFVLNRDEGLHPFLAENPTRATPTLYFLDPQNGEIVFESMGYLEKKAFLELADDIVSGFREEDEE